MNLRFTFYPVTDATRRALEFVGSPFLQLEAAMLECGCPGELQIDEQAQIVLERAGKLLTSQWPDLHVTVFCFVCEPQRLETLLSGTLKGFKDIARREVLESLPGNALPGIIQMSFFWFGRALAHNRKEGAGA